MHNDSSTYIGVGYSCIGNLRARAHATSGASINIVVANLCTAAAAKALHRDERFASTCLLHYSKLKDGVNGISHLGRHIKSGRFVAFSEARPSGILVPDEKSPHLKDIGGQDPGGSAN